MTARRRDRRERRREWWPDGTRHGDAREQAHRLIARARIFDLVHPDDADREVKR